MITTADFHALMEDLIGQNFNLLRNLEDIHPKIECFWGLVLDRQMLVFTCENSVELMISMKNCFMILLTLSDLFVGQNRRGT